MANWFTRLLGWLVKNPEIVKGVADGVKVVADKDKK